MRIDTCTKCERAEDRKKLVLQKIEQSDILVIIDAPSIQDGISGVPLSRIEDKIIYRYIKRYFPRKKVYVLCCVLCSSVKDLSIKHMTHCQNNILLIIEKVNPDTIIFMNKKIEKFYRKIYKKAFRIIDPRLAKYNPALLPLINTSFERIKYYVKSENN